MSKHKRYLVGWWLCELNKPLKSRALALLDAETLSITVDTLWDALDYCHRFAADQSQGSFLLGAKDFLKSGYDHRAAGKSPDYDKGWLMCENSMPYTWIKGRDDGRANDPHLEDCKSDLYADGFKSGLADHIAGIKRFKRPHGSPRPSHQHPKKGPNPPIENVN